MKKIISVFTAMAILFALLPLESLRVSAEKSGDYYYSVAGSEATITEYAGTQNEINIPGKLDGYSVTGIGCFAFYNHTELISVRIPETVRIIAGAAFYGCTGLVSLNVPEGVTEIEPSAFAGTAWFDNFPDGLVYAGKVAYKYKGLMPENTEIIIKEGIKSISGFAFSDCEGLVKITIPFSVKKIAEEAFRGCSHLTIRCYENSVSFAYAVNNKINFEIIQPVNVTGIDLSRTEVFLKPGETFQLEAKVEPYDAMNKAVIWLSSDDCVAAVDSNGLVTASGEGTAVVSAATEEGGYKAACCVTVAVPVSGISLNTDSVSASAGEQIQLTASVFPNNATNKSFAWKSSDTNVAEISAVGLITMVAPGQAEITATTDDGGYKAVCTVTVANNTVEPAINITDGNKILDGTLYKKVPWYVFYKKVAVQLGANIAGNYSNIAWSSGNKKVLVDQTGRITNLKTGARSAVITAALLDDKGNILAADKIIIIFYKFNFQLKKLEIR